MSGKHYIFNNRDIKLAIITPKGKIFLSDYSHDGKNMKKEYQLDQYLEYEKCEFHIDYLVVLLNKYFNNNEKYKQYLTTKNSDKLYQILETFLQDGYIIFFNNTSYNTPSSKISGTKGEILINYQKLTPQQLLSLEKLELYLKKIQTLTINTFLNYPENNIETYVTKKCDIINFVKQVINKKKLKKQKIKSLKSNSN